MSNTKQQQNTINQAIMTKYQLVAVHNELENTGYYIGNQYVCNELGMNVGMNSLLMGNYQSPTSKVQWLKVHNIL